MNVTYPKNNLSHLHVEEAHHSTFKHMPITKLNYIDFFYTLRHPEHPLQKTGGKQK